MKKVVFVHPDLGIGGAERLVVDAALALQSKTYEVSILTAHHDSSHCFPETKDELKVITAGDWLPRHIFGYLYALCAYIRMIYISLYLVYFSNILYDVAFVDQISACIPFLQCKKNTKIIFYCHYPDQLLTYRQSFLKKLYRSFIDRLELETTKLADLILVNSNFTSQVFKETFPSIHATPSILYPTLNTEKFDQDSGSEEFMPGKKIFLSLNRYEEKKNVLLAIDAFKVLLDITDDSVHETIHLVIAGGYDNRVTENKLNYEKLKIHASNLGIQDYVTFLKSPSNSLKVSLLKEALCLLYTPENEHFGIVPIEAMYVGTPVIATASGGPLETVINGETGYLCNSCPNEFAMAMKKFIALTSSKSDLSSKCHQHVVSKFSYDEFRNKLESYIQSLF